MPLIAALLGLPTEGRYPALDLTPQRQKQLTLAALVEQLEGLAAAQPVLLAYEDMHWSDPTTQELLGLTIERVQRLPVLLLITYRPEFSPPWPAQPHVSALALSRLGRREGAALVERVVRDKALPDEVAAQIVAKTDGVPLFVEELTKTVLESGLLEDAGDHYELAGPLPPLALPCDPARLAARPPRPPRPVKEIAQIGAALGREFSHGLLAAVADRPEAELQAALDQLVAAELVYRRGTPPDVTYSFKHALVQDAAYGTLLKSRRQQLHARIAQVLEEQFPETAETQPELLAHHCTEAGLVEQAVDYWHRAGAAGDRALGHAAEAIAHLTQGSGAACERCPDGPERDRRELDLQIALGVGADRAQGLRGTGDRARPTHGRASCAGESATPEQLFPALYGLWLFTHDARRARRWRTSVAEELLRLAERRRTMSALVLAGHRAARDHVAVHRGELRRRAPHIRSAAIALYNPTRNTALLLPSMRHDPRRVRAGAIWPGRCGCSGYPDQALCSRRETLAAGPATWLIRNTLGASRLHSSCLPSSAPRRAPAVDELAEASDRARDRAGLSALCCAVATILQGWALAGARRAERGHRRDAAGSGRYARPPGPRLRCHTFSACSPRHMPEPAGRTRDCALLADALDSVARDRRALVRGGAAPARGRAAAGA